MSERTAKSAAASRRLTRTQAKQFRSRWEAVNAIEKRELRRMGAEEKLLQLAAMMASARALGWNDALAADAREEEVRNRWNRLRKVLGG